MKAERSVAAKRFLVLFGASAKKNSPQKRLSPFRGIFLSSSHLFRLIFGRFLAFYGDIQFLGDHLNYFHRIGQYV